jgi:hypothetical protein
MDFLQKLKEVFSVSKAPQRYVPIRVRCKRCGEELTGRIDTYNDLSIEYNPKGSVSAYVCRKRTSGDGKNLCFQVIDLTLTYDKKRRLVEREISGGEFIED